MATPKKKPEERQRMPKGSIVGDVHLDLDGPTLIALDLCATEGRGQWIREAIREKALRQAAGDRKLLVALIRATL